MRASIYRAQQLIDAITELDLQMVVPKGLLTLHTMASRNHTWPDNIFATSVLNRTIINCMTVPGERPASRDHLPIVANSGGNRHGAGDTYGGPQAQLLCH